MTEFFIIFKFNTQSIYYFVKTKIIFYFVAENRVDFRELVRELASIFRTRIEMRQIGVRDEARLVGGYGPCGKQLCCVHQKDDFDPVSIKAVAMMVNDPPFSTFLAAPKNLLGLCKAFASTPPERIFPDEGTTVL